MEKVEIIEAENGYVVRIITNLYLKDEKQFRNVFLNFDDMVKYLKDYYKHKGESK